jgi:hypothetical protein
MTANYEIHDLANLVPMASNAEFEALKLDINVNGQKDPILLWKNKIVDGRNRQLACKQLGVEVEVILLDDKLTFNEVAKIVKSSNIRRNPTDTQRTIIAIKEQRKTNSSNRELSKSWAVSEGTIRNAKKVLELLPSAEEPLFEGKSVKIRDEYKNIDIQSNKIGTLKRILENNKKYYEEKASQTQEIIGISDLDILEVDYNNYFSDSVSTASNYFWENIGMRKDLDIHVKTLLAKLLDAVDSKENKSLDEILSSA